VPGRRLAIGDIHGCEVALDALLAAVGPTADDTIYILGDVVDRGPNTRLAVDMLLQLRQDCRLVLVLGNHEEMMFDAMHSDPVLEAWLSFGGQQTLESYGGSFSRIPDAHLELLHSAVPYVELEKDILIHASLCPDVPLPEQTDEWLRWEKVRGDEPAHPSGKRVVCGHTAQRGGFPLVWPGWVCIDTFAYGGGWLTCLDLDTGEFVQSHQVGTVRSGFSI